MIPRIVIAGGARCGKTTLAAHVLDTWPEIGAVRHTDDLLGKADWSEASEEVATWMARPGPWLIEGVSAVRALRKALQRLPDQKPCELVFYLDRPLVDLTKGQATMNKGVSTVFEEIRAELLHRKVLLLSPR
jgi:uridine kinase